MERFGDMESNAFNIFNLSNAPNVIATMRRYEYEVANYNRQMICQLKIQSKKSQMENAKILKATNENATKQLKVQQKT